MRNARTVEFVVRGGGNFPIDMLRYDSCYPKSERDSGLIESEGRREVTLESAGRFAPSHGRWESFLWRVVKVNGEWVTS